MPARPISREELYEPYSRFWNLEYPGVPKSPAMVEAETTHIMQGAIEQNWLIEHQGQVAGAMCVCDFDGQHPPESMTLDFCLDPQWEREILSETLDVGEGFAAEHRVRKLKAWCHDGMAFRIESYENRGYEKVQSVPLSRLDLAAADTRRFQPKLDAVAAAGIEIGTMEDLERRGVDWPPLLHEATQEMVRDMPSPDEPYFIGLEQFREMVKNRLLYRRDLMFVALDGDRIVGYSRACASDQQPDLVTTGLSGVARSHRRRGIVTALKVTAIRKLRERGYRWLQTDNDATNPMYQLNLDLGFVRFMEWQQFQRGRG